MAVCKSSGEIPTFGLRSEVPKSNWASAGWKREMDGGPLEKMSELKESFVPISSLLNEEKLSISEEVG